MLQSMTAAVGTLSITATEILSIAATYRQRFPL
jgi:hypothetical protein